MEKQIRHGKIAWIMRMTLAAELYWAATLIRPIETEITVEVSTCARHAGPCGAGASAKVRRRAVLAGPSPRCRSLEVCWIRRHNMYVHSGSLLFHPLCQRFRRHDRAISHPVRDAPGTRMPHSIEQTGD